MTNRAKIERRMMVLIWPHEKFQHFRVSKFTLNSNDIEFVEGYGKLFKDFEAYVEYMKDKVCYEHSGVCFTREEYETFPPYEMVPTLGTRRDENEGSLYWVDLKDLKAKGVGPKWLIKQKEKYER